MRILILGETAEQNRELVSFCQRLSSDEIYPLAFREDVAREASRLPVTKVYYLKGEGLSNDDIFAGLLQIQQELLPDVTAATATKDLNELLARLAAKTGLPLVTEAVTAKRAEALTFRRPSIGGRAVSEETVGVPSIVTISQGKFGQAEPLAREAAVEARDLVGRHRVNVLQTWPRSTGSVDVASSPIVVGVGRGFGKREDLKMAEDLAQALGGAVGCTRPIAADYGWLPESQWIGLSGKKIKPKLYMAIGLSGSAQHMAGVIDSDIIIAINKDRSCPIMEQADYYVVADLYDFVPALLRKLSEMRK